MPIEFTDRRKRVASCDDELAVVKAAAWAWHQHSSGNEGKPTAREFDRAKFPREPRPSRYRLEASADAAAFDDDDDRFTVASSEPQSPAHEEISLLDGYEIDRITRHLDRLILSTRAVATGAASRRRHGPAAAPRGGLGNGGKRPTKTGVFWVRHAVGLCGSRSDVADGAVLVGGARGPRAGFGR